MPEQVPKLVAAGFEVHVEPQAGVGAQHPDQEYVDAGASVAEDPVPEAAVVLSVAPLAPERAATLAPDAVTISFLPPADELDLVQTLANGRVTSFSMELVPRISRAQAMDALSSQALVSGYRAALLAAERLPRFFPLLMTAGGTVRPATVLVLGAGVAGLQTIATAKRLGAVVSAYDVRTAAAEEIKSLGAKSIALDLPALEGSGGYAREMGEERARLQRELLAPHVAESDVLITTAAVPGRAAPLLVTKEMVEGMGPGAVVVDLAAESGGNVEGSVAGETVRIGNAQVIGARNLPSQMAEHASKLYGANVVNLLLLMTNEGSLTIDLTDEVLDGACVTHAGEVRHEATKALLGERV